MWTENLQQQTKEHFKQYPLGPMKHFTGKKYEYVFVKTENTLLPIVQTMKYMSMKLWKRYWKRWWAID